MHMKKLLSLLLVVAILSMNLCAFAEDFNPIQDLRDALWGNHDQSVETEVSISTDAPADPGTESGDNVYVIHNVEYIPADEEVPAHFLVRANTAEACRIQILLKDENTGEVLLELLGDLPENMCNDSAKVGEDTPFDLPLYYILEAALTRISDSAPVGEPYLNGEHTAQYVRARSKTISDFSGKQIISLDDAGYAVLGDHVICVAGASSADGGYTFAYNGSLSAGDILMLDINGTNKPVKVSSVRKNSDGTITVLPDDSIAMADVYDHLQISACLEPVGAAGTEPGKIKTTTFDPSTTTGALTLKGAIHFTTMLDIIFDKESKFYSAECWVQNSGELEVILGGEFNTRDLDSPLKITFSSVGLKIPKLDTEALLEVTLPLDISAEAGGSASINFNSKTGFKFNSVDKQFVKIDEDSSEAIAKIKAKATIECGPQVRLSLEIPNFIDAEIRGQVGVRAECELTGLDYGGKIANYAEDSIHACNGCVDCDVYLFGGVYGELKYEPFNWFEAKLYDGPIFEITSSKIADAYWSFLNEKESPYGGEPSFAFTECKNVKYRAEITTEDYADRSVTGIPVTSIGVYGTVQQGVSPCTMYLYPGKNSFSADFQNSTATQTLTMPERPAALVVEEEEITMLITVRDNETQEIIPGAQVTLTLPDGSTRSAVTDSSGQCFFDKLPQGEYSQSASAANYETKTVDRLNFSAGQRVNSGISLEPVKNIEVIVISKPEYLYSDTFQGTIVIPRAYVPQYPAAEAAINAKFESLYAEAQTIIAGLKSNSYDGVNKNLYTLKVGEVYVSGAWLFVPFSEMQYTSGAARPVSFSYMLAFDVTTGAEFEAGSVIPEDRDARYALVKLIESHLRNEHGNDIFTDAGTAAGYALTSSLATWTVDTDGLHIVYSPEWIAPRYVGPIEVVLPYSELKGIIRDEFIPSNDTSSRASVSLVYDDSIYDEQYFRCGEIEPIYELTIDGFVHELWIGEEVYGYNVSDTIIMLRERVQGAVPFKYVDSTGEHQAYLFKGDTLNVPEN